MDEPQEVTRGRLLKVARIKVNLDQEMASHMLGIHRVTLSRIERGKQKKISAELYRAMADLYGIDEDVDGRIVETFIKNPAFKNRLPPKPYARVYGHIADMQRSGCTVDQIEEAERLMVDGAFNKLNARDPRERSDDEMILDIEAAWSWIREVLGRAGVKGL